MQPSKIHSFIPAGKVRPLEGFSVDSMQDIRDLEKIGIALDSEDILNMYQAFRRMQSAGMALDADIVAPLSTPSIPVAIQFLQAWMPGFVQFMTWARKIDDLIGITTLGDWKDEEIVQGFSERTGFAQPYGDETNTPLGSWNTNYERRTIVRFESGMRIGRLGEKRAAKMNYSDVENRRMGATTSLEINRNYIGFYGYNDGTGRTYGYLNDPNLPAYENVATGAGSSTKWADKTTLEIIADLLTAFQSLRVQAQGNIDVKKTPLRLHVALSCIDYLSTPTELGYSANDWLQKNYPNVTLDSAPELDAANGSANVFYLFSPNYQGDSTDNGNTIDQLVPMKFMTLGVQQLTKGYEEAYSNACAGVLCKRPTLVYRGSGI